MYRLCQIPGRLTLVGRMDIAAGVLSPPRNAAAINVCRAAFGLLQDFRGVVQRAGDA